MVSVLVLRVDIVGSNPVLAHLKIIHICCGSVKHAALKIKIKDQLARNEDSVSEWNEMSTRIICFMFIIL